MSGIERLYKICRRLQSARQPIKASSLCAEFEVDRSTIMRDIALLRDRLNAPIRSSRNPGGFYFDPDAPKFELPGIWFSANEARTLVTLSHLIHTLEPSVLKDHLRPVEARIGKFLANKDKTLAEVKRRIRVLSMAKRDYNPDNFELITHALLDRWRLDIEHYHRGRDEVTQRQVSPQRLVHYRDNWYLDTFDHFRKELRTFSLDTLRKVNVTHLRAENISDKELDKALGNSYGIFSGEPHAQAVLRFDAYRARWVAQESWHPDQLGRYLDDGRYELRIPYSDDRELIMDILKYGADVEVLAPQSLRGRVQEALSAAMEKYKK